MSDFLKSDYCQECSGEGYVEYNDEPEQCEECERLHRLELRADKMQDIMKGH